MFNIQIKKKLEKCIGELSQEFKDSPEKFLTEDDVRSYLYYLLMKNFNILEKTSDGKWSIPVHCEIRWYLGENARIRSDIVLIDVSDLRTKEDSSFKLPSKSYGFNKFNVIIEIKFRRKKYSASDRIFKNQILKDRDKIAKIREKTNIDFYSYMIILDKKGDIDFISHDSPFHREIYVSGLNEE